MKEKIRIGIAGYGNLGKGAELAVQQNSDMELVAVFSRRPLASTASGVPAISVKEAAKYWETFASGKAVLDAPAPDRWGTWISALVPIKIRQTAE